MTWFCMQTGRSIHVPEFKTEMLGISAGIACLGVVIVLWVYLR